MTIHLPEQVQKAIHLLNEAGFSAYVVGGCVRDSLFGRTPNDWDITTAALPEQTKAVFADYKTIDVGMQHGTVAVLFGEELLEITTYRVDGTYEDSRHPDQVSFTPSLEEDLARRDFTVNAMAYHPNQGLIDLFEGQKDLSAGILRCVGTPDTRFTEDALRMLRALRFASTLNFQLEDATTDSIHRLKDRIRSVSKERITEELKKFLMGAGAPQLLPAFADVFAGVLPGLVLSEDTPQALAAASPNLLVRLGVLLAHTEDPERALSGLRLSKAEQEALRSLLLAKDEPLPKDKIGMRKLLHRLDPDTVERVALFQKAYGAEVDRVLSLKAQVVERDPISLSQLALSGEDLKAFGVAPGREMGALLECLLQAVMEEQLENNKAALMEAVRLYKETI